MTEVIDDTRKGTTYGDPDGPERYIDTLDCSVPTFIDPRLDLIPDVRGRDKAFKRVDYHVPFNQRGDFKVGHWPKSIQMRYGATARTDIEGYVLCSGSTAAGTICKKRATNRTLFCPSHGGALHPADKKMASMSVATIPQDRVENLDRIQKFMQGFLSPWELDDDEIQGGFVRNSSGHPVRGFKLGAKFQAILAKELHTRLNSFLQSETSDMLKVMVDIAKNDMYEAADRIKAAQWVAEKTMGKAPDVLIQANQTNAPYSSILESIESGSRADYRKAVESSRGGDGEVQSGDDAPFEVIDAEIEPDYGEVEEEEIGEGEEGEDNELQPADEDSSESAICDEVDDDNTVLQRSQQIIESREEKLKRAKAIKKAKQRRYAARAVGATSLSAMPWLVEFVPYLRDEKSRRRVCREDEAEGFMMKLYPPDKQTPAVLEKLSNRPKEVENHGESYSES